ncbi:hypothetical protein PGT21_018864 [Puccinia graminis f. sp. tritici]|uniref:Secreted protein n=1 Tax=Puccinia graminis f. sp. tritici TaxID=56615 RepID=A0A5B0LL31_PUCGR|nr:hypothetical protein PGT21_019484 [Puccinia graminis f. sp. tritici]KAA1085774.1 hypothetical protein PGT21_018864 [Puccinia graminis f. sp. tritici]KAA1136180.1 hypothetical protein PGTUg99_034437 [Puccinia graminis f. sp. tritici]
MSGLCAIGRYGVVFALLLKSFSVAPGLGGPPPDPSLYTARCQQCWQVAGIMTAPAVRPSAFNGTAA